MRYHGNLAIQILNRWQHKRDEIDENSSRAFTYFLGYAVRDACVRVILWRDLKKNVTIYRRFLLRSARCACTIVFGWRAAKVVVLDFKKIEGERNRKTRQNPISDQINIRRFHAWSTPG